MGTLKVGSYIIIQDAPCRILAYTKSKPGKHGSAKARIVALGVFDESKRTLVKPVNAQVEVPLIDKRSGQVIALLPTGVQIMDLESYETFEAPLPNEKIRSKLASGLEVEYWNILGRTKIMRAKG